MKRIRLLILLGMVAVALPLGLLQGIAKARSTNSGTTTGSVSINQYADWDFVGATLDVGLQVACTDPSGAGVVAVDVTQYPPESPTTLPVSGHGTQKVVCDGRSRSVGVTVGPGPFDTGKAYATATLTTVNRVNPPVATASRWISVRVV
jgi:hypothetical protein